MHLFNLLIQPLNTFQKRSVVHFLCVVCFGYLCPSLQPNAIADEIIEYKVKAAFIYNFIAFTQWPEKTSKKLNLCIYGKDFFGSEIDKMQNKSANNLQIKIMRINSIDQLNDCQAVFFSKSVNADLSSLLDEVQGKPIMTLADNPNAAADGIMINMKLSNERIVFEINLRNARNSDLNISSKLLQLAVKVHQ